VWTTHPGALGPLSSGQRPYDDVSVVAGASSAINEPLAFASAGAVVRPDVHLQRLHATTFKGNTFRLNGRNRGPAQKARTLRPAIEQLLIFYFDNSLAHSVSVYRTLCGHEEFNGRNKCATVPFRGHYVPGRSFHRTLVTYGLRHINGEARDFGPFEPTTTPYPAYLVKNALTVDPRRGRFCCVPCRTRAVAQWANATFQRFPQIRPVAVRRRFYIHTGAGRVDLAPDWDSQRCLTSRSPTSPRPVLLEGRLRIIIPQLQAILGALGAKKRQCSGSTRPQLLQDILAKRQTEWDFITRRDCREWRKTSGVPTPLKTRQCGKLW